MGINFVKFKERSERAIRPVTPGRKNYLFMCISSDLTPLTPQQMQKGSVTALEELMVTGFDGGANPTFKQGHHDIEHHRKNYQTQSLAAQSGAKAWQYFTSLPDHEVSRDTFYRYKNAVDESGVEALPERTRRKPNLANRVDETTGQAVIKLVGQALPSDVMLVGENRTVLKYLIRPLADQLTRALAKNKGKQT